MKKREKKGFLPRNRQEDEAGSHDRAKKKAMARREGKVNLRKFYSYDPEEIEEEYDEES